MKDLPTGIQNIEEILSGNFVYVDKTGLAHKLITNAKHYFLSRPRRFGKSLFVSALKQIFEGNKDLFKGLKIHDSNYDWTSYPVLHFDFSRMPNGSPEELKLGLMETIKNMARQNNVSVKGSSLQILLQALVESVAGASKAVVLVDEYDHPIINKLSNATIAEKNRDELKGFFDTLKSLDNYIKFTFITGVSKFSQVSLFSGPNYLTDITMDEEYSCLLGYTEDEVKKYFSEHIKQIVRKRQQTSIQSSEKEILEEVRLWYNGYRFSKEPSSVYNPFSTLKFMKSGNPESYWYSSGTPSFLIDQIKKHPKEAVPLSGVTALKTDLMDISDLEKVDITALMFQTGYLAVQDYRASGLYHLGFPNEEVKQAFMGSLVKCFTDVVPSSSTKYQELLETQNLKRFFENIQSLFACFPYHLFTKANEATYQGMLLAILKGMGFDVHAEFMTNLGRIDLFLESVDISYIFECKLDISAKQALSQIEQKKYYEQFSNQDKNIGLIGINFSSKDRNIAEWEGKLLSASGEVIRDL